MHIFEKLLADLLKHDVRYFKSWLFTYSRNYCLMQLRKKNIEISIEEVQHYHSSLMESQEDLHQIDESEYKIIALEQALANLNEQQKTCIKMFYIDEKSYQEIVKETGYELKKVKSYIQNGKRNLMIQLSKNSTTIIVFLTIYSILNAI